MVDGTDVMNGLVSEEKYAYHITPQKNEDNILEKGVKKSNNRIYLAETWEDAMKWRDILIDEKKENICLFEVDISGIKYYRIPSDSRDFPAELIVKENIEPERLLKIDDY